MTHRPRAPGKASKVKRAPTERQLEQQAFRLRDRLRKRIERRAEKIQYLKDDVQGLFEHNILQSRGRADNLAIKLHAKRYPMTFVAFDIIERPGEVCTSRPFIERHDILRSTLKPSKRVRVTHPVERMAELYDHVMSLGGEGIMMKTKDGKYEPGRRSKQWVKAKAEPFLDALHVVGVLAGEGSRESLGSLVLANEDEGGNLVFVTKAGSGLDGATIKWILEQVPDLTRDDCPLVEAPTLDRPLVAWLERGLVADIVFERAIATAPRFPRVRSVRKIDA